MAKIYQRASDGMWVATVSMGFEEDSHGKRRRIRRVFYGKTRAAAKIKLDDALAKEGGRLRPRVESGSLSEWMTSWLAEIEHTMSPTGFANYQSVWKKHGESIVGRKRLSTFEPKDVAALYRQLVAKNAPPAQIAKLRVVLHRAFEVASQRGDYFGRNPFGLVDAPKYSAKERTSLTLPQAQKLIDTAQKSGDRWEAAVVLAIACGMRLGEILGLKWADINWREKSISVRRSLQELSGRFTFSEGKTATARRKIALGSIALDALRRREATAEHTKADDLVFSTREGSPVSRTNFRQRTFDEILKSAKLPKIRFHDLRHSFASLLLQQGTPIKVTAEALGHANPAITSRLYSHIIGDLQSRAIHDIDKALRAKPRRSGR